MCFVSIEGVYTRRHSQYINMYILPNINKKLCLFQINVTIGFKEYYINADIIDNNFRKMIVSKYFNLSKNLLYIDSITVARILNGRLDCKSINESYIREGTIRIFNETVDKLYTDKFSDILILWEYLMGHIYIFLALTGYTNNYFKNFIPKYTILGRPDASGNIMWNNDLITTNDIDTMISDCNEILKTIVISDKDIIVTIPARMSDKDNIITVTYDWD